MSEHFKWAAEQLEKNPIDHEREDFLRKRANDKCSYAPDEGPLGHWDEFKELERLGRRLDSLRAQSPTPILDRVCSLIDTNLRRKA